MNGRWIAPLNVGEIADFGVSLLKLLRFLLLCIFCNPEFSTPRMLIFKGDSCLSLPFAKSNAEGFLSFVI